MSRLERLQQVAATASPSRARKAQRTLARLDRPAAVAPPKRWSVSVHMLNADGSPLMHEVEHMGRMRNVQKSLKEVHPGVSADEAWQAFEAAHQGEHYHRLQVIEQIRKNAL